jgi:hypothetical protein
MKAKKKIKINKKDEVEFEVDLRKGHDLWRGKWRNNTRKTRFCDRVEKNEKEDDK